MPSWSTARQRYFCSPLILMKTSPGCQHAQRFLSAFSGISPHFRPRRHLLTARDYRTEMTYRFTTWRQVTSCAVTA